jgi:hypothetical protein
MLDGEKLSVPRMRGMSVSCEQYSKKHSSAMDTKNCTEYNKTNNKTKEGVLLDLSSRFVYSSQGMPPVDIVSALVGWQRDFIGWGFFSQPPLFSLRGNAPSSGVAWRCEMGWTLRLPTLLC